MLKHYPIRLVRLVCALLLTVGLVISPTHIAAQSQASTGQIAGTVHDSAGAVIANATVKITSLSIGVARSVTSNGEGLFRATLLPAGNYTVEATADGFSAGKINAVIVEVGRTVDLNIGLALGKVEQVIEVGVEAVQVSRSEPDALLNDQAITTLPINGRRFQDFVQLTPTAQVEPTRSQISLSGQRGINSNVNIDGLDYNQPFFGGLRGGERSNFAFTIPQESIREFQVVAAGYSAEFGRSTGGLVTAVTKSGTNDFHGSLYYLNRDKGLGASNEYFDTAQAAAQASLPGVEVKPSPTQHQFGGSIGGPVIKDKIFFFATMEGQKVSAIRNVVFDKLVGYTPSGASAAAQQEGINYYLSQQQPFDFTNNAWAGLARADWQINPNHRLSLRYNNGRSDSQNGEGVGGVLLPTATASISNNGTEEDRTYTAGGQLTSFFGSARSNEFRGQLTKESRPRVSNSQTPLVSTTIGDLGATRFLPSTEYDWRIQFSDNFTLSAGRHTWKFGAEYNKVYISQIFGFNQFGTNNTVGSTVSTVLTTIGCSVTLANPLYPNCPVGGANINRFDVPVNAFNYQLQNGNLQSAYGTNNLAFFLQDGWKLTPSLTVNFGLRYEALFTPTPETSNTALATKVTSFGAFPNGRSIDPTANPDQTNKWGPRLGFAWDPFKDGKTVVRGYSGVYYAATPLLLYTPGINNFRTPAGDLSFVLPFNVPAAVGPLPACTLATLAGCNTVYKQFKLIGIDLNTYALNPSAPNALPTFTPAQIAAIATAVGFNPTTSGLAVSTTETGFRDPRSVQAGFGVEHEILAKWNIGVDFSYINTTHLQRNRDFNLPTPKVAPGDLTLRPIFTNNPTLGASPGTLVRPIASLNQIRVREATARSMYRQVTARSLYRAKKVQFNAYYTFSQNYSSDDNERDATGIFYENTFNLGSEYGYSLLDRSHQFVASPLVFLPWGIEASSSLRFRSGNPVDARLGTDLNGDSTNTDRPYSSPGVPFVRNGFRNTAQYNVDMRVQKTFDVKEKAKLILMADMFNLFNAMNIQYAGSTTTNYCSGSLKIGTNCGFAGPTNVDFLSLRQQDSTKSDFGKLLLSNTPGLPFQAQFGVRFQF